MDLVYMFLFILFILFFPLPPFGFATFCVLDYVEKQREKRMLKIAPAFPFSKVVSVEKGIATCIAVLKARHGPNMHRRAYLKSISARIHTEEIQAGEFVFLRPESFDHREGVVGFRITHENVSERRFLSELSTLILNSG